MKTMEVINMIFVWEQHFINVVVRLIVFECNFKRKSYIRNLQLLNINAQCSISIPPGKVRKGQERSENQRWVFKWNRGYRNFKWYINGTVDSFFNPFRTNITIYFNTLKYSTILQKICWDQFTKSSEVELWWNV